MFSNNKQTHPSLDTSPQHVLLLPLQYDRRNNRVGFGPAPCQLIGTGELVLDPCDPSLLEEARYAMLPQPKQRKALPVHQLSDFPVLHSMFSVYQQCVSTVCACKATYTC